MKNLRLTCKVFLLALVLLSSSLLLKTTQAAELSGTGSLDTYKETFSPANAKDALWRIEVTGTPAADGFMYLPLNFSPAKDSKIKVQKVTVNGTATPFTATKLGDIAYLKVPAAQKATLVSELTYPGFFAPKKGKLATGIPAPQLNYKFINKTPVKIGSYSITIVFPEGMEPMTISSPANVTSYKLKAQEGKRTLFYELKKGLEPAAAATLNLTFGKPFTTHTSVMAALWLLIVVISIYVIKRRWQEYQ